MISLSRMISLSARGGISIDNILDQLKSCGTCPSYAVRTATRGDTSKGSCCPVAIGNALREMKDKMQKIICDCKGNSEIIHENKNNQEFSDYYECPGCHEKTLVHVGGCIQCPQCGYSKCN